MYSCTRPFRLAGNQPSHPARPSNRPSHPARPSNRPSHPARPSNRPSHPARPSNRPSHPARPSNRPSHPARPSNRPSHPARPSNRPSHPARPSNCPSHPPARPGNRPSHPYSLSNRQSNPTLKPPTLLLQPTLSAIHGTGFQRSKRSEPSITTLANLQEKKNELLKTTNTTHQAGLNHLPTHSINALMRQRERARQLSAHEISSVSYNTNSQQSLLVSHPQRGKPVDASKTSRNSGFSQLLNYYDSRSNNDLNVGSTTDIDQKSVITLPSLTNRPILSSQTLNNHASYILPPIPAPPKSISNGIEKARNFPGIRKTADTLSNTTSLPPLPAATILNGSSQLSSSLSPEGC